MKKLTTTVISLIGAAAVCTQSAHGANLLQVYQQALQSNPTYLQAVAQYKSDLEGVPIARASILPTIDLTSTGVYTDNWKKGLGNSPRGRNKSKEFTYDLQLTQTIFDMAQFNTLSEAHIQVKASAATYNAALQTLMSTVATNYFAVLKAEEDVRYSRANMQSLGRQLEQSQQQYRVGLKTKTDVDLAQSSYDNAVANFISKVNDLSNAREDLRATTGVYYDNISVLKQSVPLISPFPADPQKWVNVAVKQNWALIAQSYTAQAAQKEVDVQWDANLPTVGLQADYTRDQTRSWYDGNTYSGGTTSPQTYQHTAATSANTYGPSATLTLTVPIIEGGGTVANTDQAQYNYQVESQKYNGDKRDTISQTRQAYLTILSDISTIKADKQAIVSGESALQGTIAGYKVGTKTMVDVLKAQDTLFQAQTTYAEDRFSYITSSIKLKEETGTLSVNDLRAINRWLEDKPAPGPEYYQVPSLKQDVAAFPMDNGNTVPTPTNPMPPSHATPAGKTIVNKPGSPKSSAPKTPEMASQPIKPSAPTKNGEGLNTPQPATQPTGGLNQVNGNQS